MSHKKTKYNVLPIFYAYDYIGNMHFCRNEMAMNRLPSDRRYHGDPPWIGRLLTRRFNYHHGNCGFQLKHFMTSRKYAPIYLRTRGHAWMRHRVRSSPTNLDGYICIGKYVKDSLGLQKRLAAYYNKKKAALSIKFRHILGIIRIYNWILSARSSARCERTPTEGVAIVIITTKSMEHFSSRHVLSI